MNKIKLLYDVARVMREKEAWNGTVIISGMKGDEEAFRLENNFSRDLMSGTGKAKITSVVDHGGRRLKHESTTEFEGHQKHGTGGQEGRTHCAFNPHHGCRHGLGLKEKLDRLVAIMGALNDMQVVEQKDKSWLLSLDLKNIPESMLEHLHAKMPNKHLGHRGFMPDSPALASGSLECRVNSQYEVENIIVNVKWTRQEENDQNHDWTFNADLSFAG